MKFLVFSDIHLHNFKQFSKENSRLDETLRCLRLMFAYANKHEIEHILFPGDLFDMQKAIPTVVMNETIIAFKELFEKYPVTKFVAISGNHDHDMPNLITKEANSSLVGLATMFERFILTDNLAFWIQLRGKPDIFIYGIPYYEYGNDFKIKLDEVEVRPSDTNILLMHQTPQGIKNGERMGIDTDLSDEGYSKFDLVLCGHIHLTEQLSPKFLVVGAPMQQDFGDEGTDKGFWIIDTDDINGDWKFICLNSKFPTFIRRVEGDEPGEGEKELDYVMEVPKIAQVSEVGEETLENFRADLAEKTLIENYLDEIPDEDASFTKYGIEKDEKLLIVGLEMIPNEG